MKDLINRGRALRLFCRLLTAACFCLCLPAGAAQSQQEQILISEDANLQLEDLKLPQNGDPELKLVINRSYSTTTIKLPSLCKNNRAKRLCRSLSNYFAGRFERELIMLSNNMIDFEAPNYRHFRARADQNVYMFFLQNKEAPLTTLYAVSFQYFGNGREKRMVETFNFDREQERNLPFADLFENDELASMLIAGYIKQTYMDSKNPLLDVLVAVTEYQPVNFIIVEDGLRFFFAPGLINNEVEKIQTIKVPLEYLMPAGPDPRWWPALDVTAEENKHE